MALGRQIAACLALLAAGVLVLGCGSSGNSTANIPPEAATAFNAKLDQIQERFTLGKCTGVNSAESSFQSLQAAVDGGLLSGVDQQFITDLKDQLTQLGTQINEQCQPAVDQTTTSTQTTDTVPVTPTQSTTTDTTTTKSTTSTTTKSTTNTTPTPPTPPPPSGNGNNGSNPGGGIGPGGKKEQAR